MIDIYKLKGKMVEKCINMGCLSKKIGVSVATLYRKFNNPEDLTIGEVRKIAIALELTAEEINRIFFAINVA